jgi:hypothetical protein
VDELVADQHGADIGNSSISSIGRLGLPAPTALAGCDTVSADRKERRRLAGLVRLRARAEQPATAGQQA